MLPLVFGLEAEGGQQGPLALLGAEADKIGFFRELVGLEECVNGFGGGHTAVEVPGEGNDVKFILGEEGSSFGVLVGLFLNHHI